MTLLKLRNGNGGALEVPAIDRRLSFPSLFSDAMERFWTEDSVNWMPAVNIRERAEDFVIDLAVPGMDKKDFSVEVDNGMLTVRGERRDETEDRNDRHTRREFFYGSFRRVFNLPESADAEKISASYRDGILTLTVSKHDDWKLKPKRRIEID